jgi:glycosyltransferase involved in cell wall biosynthesis
MTSHMPRRDPVDIVIACCRDESDIIVPFIDFYLDQGFDWVCLVDNGSEDDTVARVRSHARAAHVRLEHDGRPGYDMRLLEYLQKFESLASRWVFFVDADEFVPLPGGAKRFAAQLPQHVTVLELPTAEMIPEAGLPPLLTTRRDGTAHDEIKVVWKAGVATKVYCGKHAIEAVPDVRWRDERLRIRHFHTRSETQFRRKLRNRLQTEAAIAGVAGAADALSAFSRAQRVRWVEESEASLGADGWTRECARLARVPWVEDRCVRDWYLGRYGPPSERTAPVASARPGSNVGLNGG